MAITPIAIPAFAPALKPPVAWALLDAPWLVFAAPAPDPEEAFEAVDPPAVGLDVDVAASLIGLGNDDTVPRPDVPA
jgi:hypothetical protein